MTPKKQLSKSSKAAVLSAPEDHLPEDYECMYEGPDAEQPEQPKPDKFSEILKQAQAGKFPKQQKQPKPQSAPNAVAQPTQRQPTPPTPTRAITSQDIKNLRTWIRTWLVIPTEDNASSRGQHLTNTSCCYAVPGKERRGYSQ